MESQGERRLRGNSRHPESGRNNEIFARKTCIQCSQPGSALSLQQPESGFLWKWMVGGAVAAGACYAAYTLLHMRW